MRDAISRIRTVWSDPGSAAGSSPHLETGSDELAVQIALEEYKALRAEILDRVKNEFVLITASATLTGAGVALWAQTREQSVTLLLAIPLLSFVLAFLHFAQENSIAAAAAYLHGNVRPRLIEQLPDTVDGSRVMAWEDFRAQKIFQGPGVIRAITAIGVTTPAVPGIVIAAIMAVRLLWRDFRENLDAVDLTLLSVNIGLTALVLHAAGHNVRMYRAITSP